MNNNTKCRRYTLVGLLLFTPVFIRSTSLWSGFHQMLDEMEQSMQKMVKKMNSLSQKIDNSIDKPLIEIHESDDTVSFITHVAGLTPEQINAEIVDHVFMLKAKNPAVNLQMQVDGMSVTVNLVEHITKETSDDHGVSSKHVYANRQSFSQLLPAQVMIEGENAEPVVELDGKSLVVKFAKVKKMAKKVSIVQKATELSEKSE